MGIKEQIVAKFGPAVLKRSALNIRDGEGVFKQVLGGAAYPTVLEIGTYRGVSAACMAQFCWHVHTIDLCSGRMEQLGESWNRFEFWCELGVASRITLHLVNDDVEKAAKIKRLRFDLAFIDGAHDATVRDDFELVKHCGAVLFHDYDTRGAVEKDHVYNFVNTLPKDELTIMDIFALWKPRKQSNG